VIEFFIAVASFGFGKITTAPPPPVGKAAEMFTKNVHGFAYVTLQHKTSRMCQILESEILVLCDPSVLLSRAFHRYSILQ
jgi:hypothetical protein